jgi:hypothetical protein
LAKKKADFGRCGRSVVRYASRMGTSGGAMGTIVGLSPLAHHREPPCVEVHPVEAHDAHLVAAQPRVAQCCEGLADPPAKARLLYRPGEHQIGLSVAVDVGTHLAGTCRIQAECGVDK